MHQLHQPSLLEEIGDVVLDLVDALRQGPILAGAVATVLLLLLMAVASR